MRLMDVKTFGFVEFFGSGIPPYAILSHRWGKASDEVTLPIMSYSVSRAKKFKGFRKISYCAKQADVMACNTVGLTPAASINGAAPS